MNLKNIYFSWLIYWGKMKGLLNGIAEAIILLASFHKTSAFKFIIFQLMQKYEKIIDNSYECPIFFRHLVPDTPLRGFACSGPFPGLFSGFAGGGIRSMQLKK